MPVNASFFIERKEVIGLWIILSIVMILAVAIIDSIIDYCKLKKAKKMQRINRIENEIKKIKYQNWLHDFNKSFEQIVNFKI